MQASTGSTEQLLSRVSSYLFTGAVTMLALITLLILLQVVCRNFFDLGLPWADELARFSGIALVFFAIPKLLLENKHIRMDLLLQSLSPSSQAIVNRLINLLILLYCLVSLFGFYKFLIRAAKFSTPALGMPNILFYLPALIGMVVLALIALHRTINKTQQ